jgi:tetratricopeptide (TPR) repeat protein
MTSFNLEWEQELKRLEGLSRACAEKKAYKASVLHCTEALQLAPDKALIYSNRATALICCGRYQDAHRDASIALALNPGYDSAAYIRALAKFKLGDIQVR